MSVPETPRPALDSALEKQRVELADLITRHTQQDGSFETRIKALFVSRYSLPSDFSPSLPKPALCVMAQGNKEVRLGDEYFAYDDVGYTYNFDPERGGSSVPVTSTKQDTSPAPITIVPTNTTNPDRPRTVAAGYDKDRQVITVVFRDGTFYNYYQVPYPMWQGFRMSQSKGKYIRETLDNQPRGYAQAEAVPVTVRAALYNVMRVQQTVAPDEKWQQPDLYAVHQGRQARKR